VSDGPGETSIRVLLVDAEDVIRRGVASVFQSDRGSPSSGRRGTPPRRWRGSPRSGPHHGEDHGTEHRQCHGPGVHEGHADLGVGVVIEHRREGEDEDEDAHDAGGAAAQPVCHGSLGGRGPSVVSPGRYTAGPVNRMMKAVAEHTMMVSTKTPNDCTSPCSTGWLVVGVAAALGALPARHGAPGCRPVRGAARGLSRGAEYQETLAGPDMPAHRARDLLSAALAVHR
jgi:hypothetical protein